MGTLNIINSNEFNSLMNHVFNNLPFYPNSPYLTEVETLNFVPWDPLEKSYAPLNPSLSQEIPNPNEAPKSILEELRISSTTLEQVLVKIEDFVVSNFTLNKPLRKEFNEPSNSLMVLTCPLETKLFSLTLRNALEEHTIAVVLLPQLDLRDKGKNPMTHSSPSPCDPMKFLIWNTRGANNSFLKSQYDALIKAHNPTLVALLETKMVDHKNITELIRFETYLESNVVGRKGGTIVI